MPSCNHEEADTRVVVHLYNSLEPCEKTLVRTVDTDVVVILIGKFADLYAINCAADIWVAFGTGRYFRFLSINAMAASLGTAKSRSLPFFHALTGSDTTSTFHGKGKRSAWQAWDLCANTSTEAMEYLVNNPSGPLLSSHWGNRQSPTDPGDILMIILRLKTFKIYLVLK